MEYKNYAFWYINTQEHVNLINIWREIGEDKDKLREITGLNFKTSWLYGEFYEELNSYHGKQYNIADYGFIEHREKYLLAKIKYGI
jgi:hypothetical protein